MPVSEDRMGQAGHALEVAVEDLFAYSTFETDSNVHTSGGEIDVLAETDDYHVAIECKEYKPSSTSRVTRSHISNIATKADHIDAPNAILVTTKPPSEGLQEFARERNVVVRTWQECEPLQQKLRKANNPEARTKLLIREFSLVQGGASRTKREIREFVRVLFSPNGDWASLREVGKGVVKDNWATLGLGLGALVLSVALAAAFIPAVQNALTLAFYTIVAGVMALVMWKSGFWDVAEDT